jgi:hypothetical protein
MAWSQTRARARVCVCVCARARACVCVCACVRMWGRLHLLFLQLCSQRHELRDVNIDLRVRVRNRCLRLGQARGNHLAHCRHGDVCVSLATCGRRRRCTATGLGRGRSLGRGRCCRLGAPSRLCLFLRRGEAEEGENVALEDVPLGARRRDRRRVNAVFVDQPEHRRGQRLLRPRFRSVLRRRSRGPTSGGRAWRGSGGSSRGRGCSSSRIQQGKVRDFAFLLDKQTDRRSDFDTLRTWARARLT